MRYLTLILALAALPGCLGITTTINSGKGDTKGIDAGDLAVDPEAVGEAAEKVEAAKQPAPKLPPLPAPTE